MAYFQFTAVGRDGKRQEGREFADTRQALEQKLKGKRLVLVEAKEIKAKRVANAIAIGFIAQLAELVANGVVLDRALQIITENAEAKKVAELAAQLRQGIKRGQALSQAMNEAGQFDPLLIPLLRAGEVSGQMDVILTNLQEHYRRKQKLNREIAASLTYPAVLAVACVASIVGLGIYVIPVFSGLFEDRMATLPASTRTIFWLSDAIIHHGLSFVAVLSTVLIAAVLAWRRSRPLQIALDRSLLTLPTLGAFLGKVQAANILAVLGVLLSNGVSLAPAMELAVGVARNRVVRSGLEQALNDVRRGKRFTAALERVAAFPRSALQMVSVGEETGRLAEICTRTALSLQDDIQTRLKSMVALLEPVLILVMGGTVGFVVVSMLLAVYSMSNIG